MNKYKVSLSRYAKSKIVHADSAQKAKEKFCAMIGIEQDRDFTDFINSCAVIAL